MYIHIESNTISKMIIKTSKRACYISSIIMSIFVTFMWAIKRKASFLYLLICQYQRKVVRKRMVNVDTNIWLNKGINHTFVK